MLPLAIHPIPLFQKRNQLCISWDTDGLFSQAAELRPRNSDATVSFGQKHSKNAKIHCRELGWVTFKGPFQPKPCGDSVIPSVHLPALSVQLSLFTSRPAAIVCAL